MKRDQICVQLLTNEEKTSHVLRPFVAPEISRFFCRELHAPFNGTLDVKDKSVNALGHRRC